MNKRFSFIIATCGRDQDVSNLLDSICNLNYDLNTIEIIIMDQNTDSRLDPIVSKFPFLLIRHIKSKIAGLSYNRNIGIELSTADYLCFPDDDCLFYEDTLSELDIVIKNNKSMSVYFGCIYDRKLKQYALRKWPLVNKNIGLYNALFVSTSTTIFVEKSKTLKFNESLGLGTTYGSCEDVDYTMRMISTHGNGFYSPSIQIYHPKPSFRLISLNKTKSYAAGFGYFVRNDFNIHKMFYLFLLILKKTFQFFYSFLYPSSFPKLYFYNYFLGLFKGLLKI